MTKANPCVICGEGVVISTTTYPLGDWFLRGSFVLIVLALIFIIGIEKGRRLERRDQTEEISIAVEDATVLCREYVNELGARFDEARQENIEFRKGGCLG